jgi:hypothetical protein
VQRKGAAKNGDDSGERDNHEKDDERRFRRCAKDFFAKKSRQNNPQGVTGSPANEREQKLFCRQQEPDRG